MPISGHTAFRVHQLENCYNSGHEPIAKFCYAALARAFHKRKKKVLCFCLKPDDSFILFDMAIDNILAQIDSEIARLTQVRALLTNVGTTGTAKSKAAKAPAKAKKKRVLSADARKRIAEAQRKRWAAQKAKTKGK